MERFFSLALLLILLLAACTRVENSWNCSKGVCVQIRSAGAVKKDATIPVVIKFKVDKDQPEMQFGLTADPGITLEDPVEKAGMKSRSDNSIAWTKQMKAGEEITIHQNIRIKKTGNYTLVAMAVLPHVVVRESVVLGITEEGGVEYLPGTKIPVKNPAPVESNTPGATPTLQPSSTWRPTHTPSATELP